MPPSDPYQVSTWTELQFWYRSSSSSISSWYEESVHASHLVYTIPAFVDIGEQHSMTGQIISNLVGFCSPLLFEMTFNPPTEETEEMHTTNESITIFGLPFRRFNFYRWWVSTIIWELTSCMRLSTHQSPTWVNTGSQHSLMEQLVT